MTPFVDPINLDDIALAAMQGRLATGKSPSTAAIEAWTECVDAYLDARDKYLLANPNVEVNLVQDDGSEDYTQTSEVLEEDIQEGSKPFILPPSNVRDAT